MRTAVGLSIFLLAACPAGKTSRGLEPGVTPSPELGAAWPEPACAGEAVPVFDARYGARGEVIADGGRLYMRGEETSTLEVAWEWGGPSAVLARGPADRAVESFAVDDHHVYWSISSLRDPVTRCLVGRDGAIYRVPKGGGAVELVADHLGAPDHLGLDGGRVFWRDEGPCPRDIDKPTPRFITRLGVAGGKVETIVEDPALVELVVGPGTLWMLSNDELVQTDASGGARKVLAKTPAARSLVVTQDRFFVAMQPNLDPAYVAAIPRAGGAPRAVVQPRHGVFDVLADDDTLYVTGGGEVLATPLAGGPVEVFAENATLAGLAGDRVLLWHRSGEPAVLESVPRTQRISELVASGLSRPSSMAIDRESVYWITFEAIWRRSLDGGEPVKVTDKLDGFSDRIALAGDKIVVADDGGDRHGPGRIGVVPIGGRTVTWLATDLDAPLEIAATSTDAIYGDGRGSIWRVPLAGGAPVQLVKGSGGFVSAVVTDGTTVYFGRYNERELYGVPVRGGKVATVGAAADPPMSLLLADRDVVIATQFGVIQRVAAAGGTPRTIARASGVPGSLASDATHIYWITTAAIERVPRAGGVKERIGTGAQGVIVVGEHDVFWSEDDYLGTVRRIAKRPSGAVGQSEEPESGPLAVAGDKVYVGTRTDVRELDLATGEFPVILAMHRTPQWVGTDGTTVFAIAEDKLWAIDLAEARKQREELLARTPRSTDRELALDSDFTPPASTSPLGPVGRAIVAGAAAVWISGDHVYRLAKTGGLVQTLASGLVEPDWIASDAAGTVYVTARDGETWGVFALGAPGSTPTRVVSLDRAPAGFAVDATGFVVSTERDVVRYPRDGGAREVLAAHQRGAGPVAASGRAVYWMTRDGIMTTDGTGCGAHRIARWPDGGGILPGSSLVATDTGVVFTDIGAGIVTTVR